MRSRLSDEFDEFVVLASPRVLLFAYHLTGDLLHPEVSSGMSEGAAVGQPQSWSAGGPDNGPPA